MNASVGVNVSVDGSVGVNISVDCSVVVNVSVDCTLWLMSLLIVCWCKC